MNIMPEYANIEKNGQIVQIEPETVAIGDIIIVQPGEKFLSMVLLSKVKHL